MMASMGPWLRSHGRLTLATGAAIQCLLQWGRGFAATEGSTAMASAFIPGRLQWGRGFAATEGFWAAMPRMERWQCFNGAVASQPRKGRGLCHARILSSRFNGAVASQPRMGGRRHVGGAPRYASMGPWLRSHGRVKRAFERVGPAGKHQWGRGFAATEGMIRTAGPPVVTKLQWGRGFAATEGDRDRPAPDVVDELQWGRGFAATEGRVQDLEGLK